MDYDEHRQQRSSERLSSINPLTGFEKVYLHFNTAVEKEIKLSWSCTKYLENVNLESQLIF